MRTAYRLSLLTMGLLPPLLYVAFQELAAAKLVDLCAMECDSTPANLTLLSFFAFIFLTPALLITFLGTFLVLPASGKRIAGLAILLVSFYILLFAPSPSPLASNNPFVQPALVLFPLLLVMGMGYLFATARTPRVIVAVLLVALIPATLAVVAGFPAPGSATQYSCSETTVVNATSPFPEYTNACSPYQATLAGPSFPSDYAFWVTISAVVAAVVGIVFFHSYRPETRGLPSPPFA